MKRKASGSSRLLIQEPPLQVLPSLAAAIGLNEAIIVQQMHWLLQHYEHVIEGTSWIYNTFEQWRSKFFPFWGINTIKRAMHQLEELGIVEATTRFNHNPIDKTWWYTINYARLNDFCRPTTAHDGSSTAHDGLMDSPSWAVSSRLRQRSKTPNPTSGEQNENSIGEQGAGPEVCSGDDRPMADMTQTAPLPKNSRAHGTSRRQLAAKAKEAAQQKEQEHIAACSCCDSKGKLLFFDATGVGYTNDCPHDLPRILAYVESHAYTWPHAPPTDHGPAP